MSTVQAALTAANRALSASDISDASRDTRRLMAACLEIRADRLMMHVGDPLGDVTEAAFFAMIQLRLDRMPVSRILGTRAFYGRDFIVTPDVLDPRPETETLIAAALDGAFANVLDLGTGSGAIAVTLLAEKAGTKGVATDLSDLALNVASQNAKRHGVDDRLGLVASDWFDDVTGQFDLVVSNPPYIAFDEMSGLSRDVREHDPRMALTDEGDGLGAYRAITAEVGGFLCHGGRLLVEIGPTQGDVVAALFRDASLNDVRVSKDLDGRDRVVCGRKG